MAIGRGGKSIDPTTAPEHIYGYAIGIDLTRRDLQTTARDAGLPWDTSKAFDQSAPCTAIAPAQAIGHPQDAAIWLTVDGVARQSANIAQMIWSSAAIIAEFSRLFTLQPDDLIFTGTPDGVGPVWPGNRVEAAINGIGTLSIAVT